MRCYRDMTFCISPCATDACPRRLTDEVRAAAREWWGGDRAPMSLRAYAATCPDYTPPTKDLP